MFRYIRGGLVGLIAVGVFVSSAYAADKAAPVADSARIASSFSFQRVINKAKSASFRAYKEKKSFNPEDSDLIGYDAWRDIRFKKEKALWLDEGSRFTVEFFLSGFIYQKTVKINTVVNDVAERLDFSVENFAFGDEKLAQQLPPEVGYAGFRLHFPINTPEYRDEVIVFLGASYFRAVAKDQKYGLSARGIALDTATDKGEEFPDFTEFWIIKPKANDKQITVYALLDGPSMTGAYRFVISPGQKTIVDVDCEIFPRVRTGKLGVAPLTSMFFYGENTFRNLARDFRPEVHDSDGLSIIGQNGEWIWRPLANSHRLQINTFNVGQPRGYGLMQRDVDFDHYQDLEAWYGWRPSLWITPKGEWGQGRLELVQIPTENEYNDNIVAYWVPNKTYEPHELAAFSYTMTWSRAEDHFPPSGRVEHSRITMGKDRRERQIVLEFSGDEIKALDADTPMVPIINIDGNYDLKHYHIQKNTMTGGWRVLFNVAARQEKIIDNVISSRRASAEIRVFLKNGDVALSETWSYLIAD